MSKLSRTGGNREAMMTGCAGDSKAGSWCPASVTRATRTYMLPSGFGKYLIHSVKELEVLLMDKKILLCWDCSQCLLQEPQGHCEKSSPAGHQNHQSQHQPAQWRKWIDSWCAHFVSANKTIKLRKKNQLPIRMTKIRKIDHTKCWKAYITITLILLVGMSNGITTLETMWQFF